jgi:hypothetical protein
MKDIIRTTAITSAMFLTAISPIASNAKGMETPITSTGKTAIVNNLYQTNDGSVGRLTVGGYSANLYAGYDQYIVDNYDSAAYMGWGSMTAIADHAGQGFDAIKYNSSATITDNATILYLTKVAQYNDAINTGAGINLADGTYAESLGYPYCMYTCNDTTGVSVTVTYWNVTGSAAVAAPEPVYVAPVVEEPVVEAQPVVEEPVVEAQPVYEAPAAEPVYEAPVQQQVYEAPVAQPVYQEEAAPAETQQIVDTTEAQPAQPAADQTTETKQNAAAESVKADPSKTNEAAKAAEQATDTNNQFATASYSFAEVFSDMLTANEQDVSDTENAFLPEYGREAYYADNRRWLALSAEQSDSSIHA